MTLKECLEYMLAFGPFFRDIWLIVVVHDADIKYAHVYINSRKFSFFLGTQKNKLSYNVFKEEI